MPFLARLIFTAIALVAGATLIAVTPLTVTFPIVLAVLAGTVVTGLVVHVDGRRARPSATATAARAPVAAPAGGTRQPQPDAASIDRPEPEVTAGDAGRGGLAVLSVALLALALVVPEELAVAMIAIGLAGLFVLRLTAHRESWWSRPTGLGRQRPARGPHPL